MNWRIPSHGLHLKVKDRHLKYSVAKQKFGPCTFDLLRNVVKGQQCFGQFWTPCKVRLKILAQIHPCANITHSKCNWRGIQVLFLPSQVIETLHSPSPSQSKGPGVAGFLLYPFWHCTSIEYPVNLLLPYCPPLEWSIVRSLHELAKRKRTSKHKYFRGKIKQPKSKN